MNTRIIPLGLNESYWLFTPELREKCIPTDERIYGTYPDYTELRARIAENAGSRAENIVLTNGSDAAIRIIYEYCKANSLRSLVPIPTFSGYEAIAQQVGYELQLCLYTEQDGSFIFPIQEVLSAIRTKTIDILFICHPNNPLGSMLDEHDLNSILDAARDANVTVVIDEAYAEFTGAAGIDRLNGQQIVIVRTFSKCYGLPGVRVGYAITNSSLARELNSRILPWPISSASVYIVLRAMENEELFATRRQVLIDERTRFSNDLAQIPGMTVYPSVGNFVLVRIDGAERMAGILADKGIRSALGETKTMDTRARQLLAQTLRFAVPSPEDRPLVIDAIRSAVS